MELWSLNSFDHLSLVKRLHAGRILYLDVSPVLRSWILYVFGQINMFKRVLKVRPTKYLKFFLMSCQCLLFQHNLWRYGGTQEAASVLQLISF